MHISRCCKVAIATISLCFVWASASGVGARAQEKPMYKVDPFLAQTFAEQVDHAAGSHADSRQSRSYLGAQSFAGDPAG